MEKIIFDREPGIVPLETTLKEYGIELFLKAAGQKVGLAEVKYGIFVSKHGRPKQVYAKNVSIYLQISKTWIFVLTVFKS